MAIEPNEEDTLREEYDFAALGPGVRGKHYDKAKRYLRTIRLDERLATAFPDEIAVQRALDAYLTEHPELTVADG